MEITFHIAETEEELEQIYRLRYEIYVEEMHIFGSVADHERRLLYGQNDRGARLLYAKLGNEIIASMRLNLGKDGAFSEELEETYNLNLFRPTLDDTQILVLTRFMIKKDHRGSHLSFRMIEQVAKLCLEEDIEMAVCDCQPHLIRYYQRMGFRSYDCEVYNDPEFGIMTPLAFVLRDLQYLASMRSPLKKALDQPVEDVDRVLEIASLLGAPTVDALDEMDLIEKNEIFDRLVDVKTALFADMSREDIRAIVSKGYVLSLCKDDLIIREGQQTATVFIVLDGEVEIWQNGNVVRRATSGEVVGELGFLLDARRSANVVVASDDAVILSLDESRLKQRIKPDASKVSRLLYNLCNILASRVACGKHSDEKMESNTWMVAA